MRKITPLLFSILLLAELLQAQTTSSRKKSIAFTRDTLVLDTLTIIPGSLAVQNKNGSLIDSSDYVIVDHHKIVFLKKGMSYANDSLVISYRTLPYLLNKPLQHKNVNDIRKDASGVANPFSYTSSPPASENPFKTDGLNKNGSISRGINFGNNQDVVVNSNLNLQLSGKLNDNINILLAATDNNIPIQPDGNTQQLQDFDKVFIQLSDDRSKLIAGDFSQYRPNSYFLNFNKKAQGLSFSTLINTKDTSRIFTNTVSAAVSRGKFARNIIQGVEGNQGPYRLRGAENEPFIIVLSGTEKIYIDGVLLTRGQEYDYVIDYNTSEITFTPKQFITKDKRIIAEFQYSDKNYARSLYYVGSEFKTKKAKTGFHIYSEQDSKNKPLQQDLSDDQKKILIAIGDTLNKAVSTGIDSVAFNSNEVLYEKKDSTLGSFTYNDIYVYSIDPENAFYRLTFSFVGAGNGNYVQINSGANGRVFGWVIPDTITGRPRGSYEPVISLVTPKQKQVVVANSLININSNTKLSVEGALSKNDINTFSARNSSDDIGYAGKLSLSNSSPLRQREKVKEKKIAPWKINSALNYEHQQKYFSPIERFRAVEFERDWNRPVTSIGGDQHIISAQMGLIRNTEQSIGYEFNSFVEQKYYNAYKHSLRSIYSNKHFFATANGSWLDASTTLNRTRFIRHNARLVKKFNKINIGIWEMQEQSQFRDLATDTLLKSSFDFFEWEAFIQNGDTLKNKYQLSYKQRSDYSAKNNTLTKSTFAESVALSMGLIKNTKHQLNTTTTYRRLSIIDSSLSLQKPDETMAGRIEYNTRLWKNAVLWNTFYEIGSGLELKKEFSFIEVAPGQGSYAWTDYNNNGVKELNEFEVAAFSDQAKYIKVFTPTNNYIKTYTNQFTQMLNLRPAAIWTGKKGLRKALSLLSNQTAYQAGKKVTTRDPVIAFNPFLQLINDSTLVSLNSSVRNTLYINQSGTVFGMDLSWQDAKNKSILVNGLDSRTNIQKEIRTRWNISKVWSTIVAYREGKRSNSSEFFSTRNYRITFYETEPRISYQPNTSFRSTVSFRFSDKRNHSELGGQKAQLQDYGADIRYNILNKGSLTAKCNFISIVYNDATNTSIAYEMLESLKPGKNFTWGMSYQRTLSNSMQISLNYDGRKTPGNKSIHTGGAQVRAFF